MKKYFFGGVISFSLVSTMICSDNSHNSLPPIYVTIHNNSRADAQNQQSSSHESYQQVEDGRSLVALVEKLMNGNFENFIQRHSSKTCGWVMDHKITSCAITLLTSYSAIAYQLYKNNLIMNDADAWTVWLQNRSLEQMLEDCYQKNKSDLLFAIQERYVCPDNPADFIYPLVQFSAQLQKEIDAVRQQIFIYELLQSCYCLQLFFLTPQDIVRAQERLKKLLYIKQIFSTWCASYKIEQNVKE